MNSLRIRRPAIAVMALLGSVSLLRVSAAAPDSADAPKLQIAGAVTKPQSWTAAELAATFAADIHPISYMLKGVKHTARAIPLMALIQAATPKTNTHIKHHELQFTVAAAGHDGYTADFSLGELLPEIGNHPVWVALDEDGKSLVGEAAPAELIVPDDVKPARWVHSLVRIVLVDGAQAS